MRTLKVQFIVGIILLAGIAAAVLVIRKGGGGASGDLKKDFSYTLGAQYAQNIKKQNVEVDKTEFIDGALDVLNGNKMRLTDEQMSEVLRNWQTQFDQATAEKAKANRAEGEKFEAQYKSQSEVKTSKSGVLYRVLKAGTGPSAKPTELVKVHYTGKLINGEVFDTSLNLPDAPEMPLKNLIPGWLEILPMMPKGSKWEVVIPARLGYGDSIHPKIPAGSTLIFEIEVLDIKQPVAK